MEQIGQPGRKGRAWQASIPVSASGPDFTPKLEEGGYTLRPRLAADLRYTTADVAFFAEHWQRPWPDSGEELHVPQLQNPGRSEVVAAFIRACDWLETRSRRPDWDGGHITFTFAGHGRDLDGSLVVEDGYVTADELYRMFVQTAERWAQDRRLRLAVILDSCRSGAFLIDFLELAVREPRLRIEYLAAACMPDELAWEESGLGHGVFTYCWSVRPGRDHPPFGSLAAVGIQPDNSFGPSLDIARGPFGCSLLTHGRQNPIFFADDALNACGTRIPVYEDSEAWKLLPTGHLKASLLQARDRFRSAIPSLQPQVRVERYMQNDAETRAAIREMLASPRRATG